MHDSILRRRGSLQETQPYRWKQGLFANVIVVTYCNRHCPLCCEADMVRRSPPRDVSIPQIVDDIVALGDVGVVLLTGGESTLHEDFVGMLESAREARGNRPLTLYTNGYRLMEYAAHVIRYCDRVNLSVYGEDSNAGEPTDPTVVERFRTLCPPQVHFSPFFMSGDMKHQASSGGASPCYRLFITISAQEGRVYPCSVAHGIANAEYTDLSPGWERRLLDVAAPCERCVFGEHK
jgi:hypothetical protein